MIKVDRSPRPVSGLRSTNLSGRMRVVNLQIQTRCLRDRRAAAQFNKPDAVNPAMALWSTINAHWRRVTDLECSAQVPIPGPGGELIPI
jgi:hypothetical protein